MDYDLGSGSGDGEAWTVARRGWFVVDDPSGEDFGFFVGMGEFVFGVVAGGALVFVCEVSVGAKVSDFGCSFD